MEFLRFAPKDVPAWLSLILAGRPWPASEVSTANHHHGDSSGGQYHYEPSPNIQGPWLYQSITFSA
jgi:hypothetical protein